MIVQSRHRAREVALQILYRYDMAATQPSAVPAPVGAALAAELALHFDHFQVPPELREFAAQLVVGSLMEKSALDELIEKQASNWKVSRMASVDRSLLRMALCELKRFPETAPSIVIDEAVELAKQFGTAETPAFINGILDGIRSSGLLQSAT